MAPPKYVCYRLQEALNPFLSRKFAYMNCEVIRNQPGILLHLTAHLLKSPDVRAKDLRSGTILLVCVAANTRTGILSLEEGRWIGMCSLLRPLSSLQQAHAQGRGDRAREIRDRMGRGRLFFKPSERNLLAFSTLHQAVGDIMAAETRQTIRCSAIINESTVYSQVTLHLKAYSLCGSSALESFLATEARVVCHATRIKTLELGKRMYQTPQEFLCEEDYMETIAAVYELVHECRLLVLRLCSHKISCLAEDIEARCTGMNASYCGHHVPPGVEDHEVAREFYQ